MSHVEPVVDGASAADGLEEGHVFQLMGVALGALIAPGILAVNLLFRQVARPLRAQEDVGDLIGTPSLTAAVGEEPHAVGIFVDHAVVIVDLPDGGLDADLPSAGSPGPLGGPVFQGPRRLVEAVDVLLDVMVAGEPGEWIPVAHLVFHFGPLGLSIPVSEPGRAAVVGLLNRHDPADGPVADPLDRLQHARVIAIH